MSFLLSSTHFSPSLHKLSVWPLVSTESQTSICIQDNTIDSLKCGFQQTVYVDSTSYGCPAHYPCAVNKTCLNDDKAFRQVRAYCQARQECSLAPSPSLFNASSCYGGKNYLNVTYHCQNSK